MAEGLTPYDDFPDDSEFDRVEERVVPSDHVPFFYNGVRLELTPANAAVRLFFENEQGDLGMHSRVIVYLGDGSEAAFKPEDEFMRGMVRKGIPVELPDRPDESDEEFLAQYTRACVEEVTSGLGIEG